MVMLRLLRSCTWKSEPYSEADKTTRGAPNGTTYLGGTADA